MVVTLNVLTLHIIQNRYSKQIDFCVLFNTKNVELNFFILPQRIFDVYVPIQRDRTKIEYAGCGTHDVKSDPGVAKSGPEDPIA